MVHRSNILLHVSMGLLLLLYSHSACAQSLDISDAVVRLPPPVSSNTAVYVNIYNNNDKAVTIVALDSPIADKTMMHGINKNNGMMHMFPIEKLTIPPHARTHFVAGKQHIMMMRLKHRVQAGEKISVTLTLDHGQKQTFIATVTDLR